MRCGPLLALSATVALLTGCTAGPAEPGVTPGPKASASPSPTPSPTPTYDPQSLPALFDDEITGSDLRRLPHR